MRFGLSFVVAGLAALVSAQAANPFTLSSATLAAGFTAGQTVEITWTPTTKGTVTIDLKKGAATNLFTVLTIADHIPNTGSYQWHINESELKANNYAFEIIDDTDVNNVNYSAQFAIDSKYSLQWASVPTSTATSTSVPGVPYATPTMTPPSTEAPTTTPCPSTTTTATTLTFPGVGSNSTATIGIKTTASGGFTPTSTPTTVVSTGSGMQFRVGGSMLALVGLVMIAL